MPSPEPRLTVQVRIPGSQKFTPEQQDAIRDLLSDLEDGGYDATYPRVITASATLATLGLVGLYIAEKVGDKALGLSVDKLLDIGVAWAKRQFKKHPRQRGDDKQRTTRVIIYGPNRKPLKEIKVVEDIDDDNDNG